MPPASMMAELDLGDAAIELQELLADNKAFIAMAGDLLRSLRGTEGGSCVVCGAPRGEQHVDGHVCRTLVEWRATTQYGRAAHDG